MHIMIVAVGSLGDIAPFTGLGARLRAAGYDVTLVGYEHFRGYVRSRDLEFRGLGGDPRARMASKEGQRWQQGGAGPIALARFVRLVKAGMWEVSDDLVSTAVDADVLLLSELSFVGYHVAEYMGIPSIGVSLLPTRASRDFVPAVVDAPSLSPHVNLAYGEFLNRMRERSFSDVNATLRARLGLPRLPPGGLRGKQDAESWPVLHGFSPTIVPRPADWRTGLEVSGYWWPQSPPDWEPPEELVEFLDNGEPPVFVGFGSRSLAGGDELGQLVCAALRKAGVRGVIQEGWTGLSAHGEDMFSLKEVLPYEWLFPKMAAVVNHVGAGTAGAGLRAGVPTVPVPVIVDQPFWSRRLVSLGVSPQSVPYKRLSVDRLASAVRAAVTKPSYQKNAEALAHRIEAEDGAGNVIEEMQRRL